MKWFWYSLLGFILLMCSCGTKKSTCLVNETSKGSVQTSLIRFEALKDTFNTLRIEIDKSKLRIIELIINRKYDKDTGVITEETKTERTITQDFDQAIAEEEQKRTEVSLTDSLNHYANVNKMVESKVTEESEDASMAFWREIGRWIGIVIAFILAFKIFWPSLKKKF